MRAIPQRQPLFLGGSIGGVPSFDLNFARGDNAVTKYGFVFTRATSATYVNSTGLIATAASGELRYTYDPVTLSALGVLIEEQRTNLVNRSEELNNGAFWNPVRTTPTPSATTGPNGVANSSCSILETAVTNTFHLDFSFTPAATTTYACSVFFKGGLGRGYATMDVTGGGGATGSCTINLTTGAVTAGSGTVQSYPNGWWRVSFTTTTVTTATLAMRLWCSNDGTTSPSYAGDITKGIYAWGAQIEVGAFVTSYIPSISASATRNADVLSLTGAADVVASWFNKDAGTWLVERYGSPAAIASAVCVDDGAATNRILVRQDASRVPHFIVGSTADVTGSAVVAGSAFKTAAAYAANDVSVSIGGGAVSTDATVTLPAGMTTARIGSSSAGEYANAPISRIRYYPRRLPNATLKSLTA